MFKQMKISAVQGVGLAVGFLLVFLVIERVHPGLAAKFLMAGQNHP